MLPIFTRVTSVMVALVLTVALAGAQTLSPYSFANSARGAKQQTLRVDESVVLPKGEGSFRLNVPSPTGETSVLELYETSVFAPEMRARYPAIRTYRGFDVATGQVAAVMEGSRGINIYVAGEPGSWQIEADGPGLAAISYVHDADDLTSPGPYSCGYTPGIHAALDAAQGSAAAKHPGAPTAAKLQRAQVVKRKYVLALASTGEFAVRYGGTKESVNEVYAEALNILNAITLSEVAVEYELHPKNDTLIFLSPGSDPYLAPTDGPILLDDNQAAINARLPVNSYDIGHVFTNGCAGGIGGIAGGRACQNSTKARGVTCHYAGLRRIVEDVMAHEFAHQFAVSHTFNNCPTADNQRAGQTAFEPGSGSTIMSYQGACGPANNVSEKGDEPYYHVGSVQQFQNYLASALGASCADERPVPNNAPVVSAPGIDGLTIPKQTPFVLRGSATDEDNDPLLYNWEQYDLGPAVDLCDQREDTPLFRSLPPTSGGNVRYFPTLDNVLSGRNNCEEQLPLFTRDLTFRLTARDRNPVGGGTTWQEVKMRVDAGAGPFRVTSQASAAVQYSSKDFVNVTWEVAGTNTGAIGVQKVEILLSTDGGRTFPTLLAASTDNDGSEGVLLPDTESDNARIMVRPIGNVFYAVSASTFTISTPTAPGFSFAPSASTTFLCLPANDTASARVELFTGALLGFSEAITLSIEGDVPAGIDATLTKTTIQPGESSTLVLNLDDYEESALVAINVVATADGVERATRRIEFDLVSNNFDDLALEGPDNGETGLGILPTFAFTPSRRATEHVIQVNTDPNFGFGTFEITSPDPNGDQLPFQLEINTVYFWRVVPKNRCGESLDVPVNAFHTYAADCRTFKNDQSFGIAANSTNSVTIPVPVPESGIANDINVPLVDIRFGGGINNLVVALVSPDNTEVRLYNKRCSGGLLISGYDDEAPLENNCTPQPIDGQLRKPNRPLSAFDGKEIQGVWKLRLDISAASPAGGEFKSFNLQFCADIVSQAPAFRSKLVPVPQGGFQYLITEYLTAVDPDNGAEDLEYILVTPPTRGHLELYGQRLETGARFTQAQTQSAGLTYVDDLNTPGVDSMRIVLSDNAGNLIATPRVDFMIDPNNITGVKEAAVVGMTLAPNPTGSWSRLRFSAPSEGGQLTILDAQGRAVHTERVAVGQSEVDIDADAYPVGIYLVNYRGAEGARTMRLVRQ